MIIGIDKLHQLVEEKKLVENLCERELKNPEGAGFDLRVGEIYELEGKGFLGVDERETPKMKLLAKFEENKKIKIVLEKGKYYVVKTIEKVNTPENIAIIFRPRSTLYRSGISLVTGNVAPGYKGELNFGLICNHEFELEMGARIAHALFFRVDGKTALYRGQWQEGRTTTAVREKQV